MIDTILKRLKKIVFKKDFDPIIDYSSDGSVGDVYDSIGNNEDEIVEWYADYLEEQGEEHDLEAAREKYEKMDKAGDYPVDGPIFDVALKDYINTRFEDFAEEFTNKATIVGNKLEVYRCIALEDPEKFLKALKEKQAYKEFKGTGVYWSWDKDAAECHSRGEGKEYLMSGLVSLKTIDYEATAHNNMATSIGWQEKEITIKEGSSVLVTRLEGPEGIVFDGKLRTIAYYKPTLIKALNRIVADPQKDWTTEKDYFDFLPGHGRLICKECGTLIGRCRCIDKKGDHKDYPGLCPNCVTADTLKHVTGDDDLYAILRTDNDGDGQQYWEVKVYHDGFCLQSHIYYSEKEGQSKLKEVYDSF